MSIISLIAAIDENYGIGKNNHLLCHLPADLQYFKSVTMGKPIIMGKNVFDSIAKPLPGRRNLVLSHKVRAITGVEVVESLTQALELTATAPEVMIIGGATVYAQTLALASRIYLTVIHHTFNADVFFPELDFTQWDCTTTTFRPKDLHNPYDLTFYIYERKKPAA